MRILTVAFALGTALVLCDLGAFSTPAHARKAKVVHEPRVRLVVTPVIVPTPYWDSYIVPRYRYHPQDDRVDSCGPPVAPVVRIYGGWTYSPLLSEPIHIERLAALKKPASRAGSSLR